MFFQGFVVRAVRDIVFAFAQDVVSLGLVVKDIVVSFLLYPYPR